MNQLFHGTKRNYNFSIKGSNYAKAMIQAIKTSLPDETPYKERLIWTIDRFDFKGSKYRQIILIVQEYGATLTFGLQDEGLSYELTIPELALDAKPRRKWLGLF